jgi:hypothetical protein
MGQPEPIIPDEDLQGPLRKAVEQVRRDLVSGDLVERCASQAAEIPGLEAARSMYADLGPEGIQESLNSWRWSATVCLATSLLITLSLNALQIALDRPDPYRQQAALLKTANQLHYRIYSDLRLEREASISIPR